MKKGVLNILCMFVLLVSATFAQGQTTSVSAKKILPVTTVSKAAKELALKGANCLVSPRC